MLNLEGHSNQAALLGRLFMSSLFVVYGYKKLTGFAGTEAYMAKFSALASAPKVFAAIAVIVELGGGLLILFGYKTRCVALACAIYVIIAALLAHSNLADPNQMSHFFKNMAIVGGFLMLVANGAGAYSLDARKK
jgi:putative oxidoreductase